MIDRALAVLRKVVWRLSGEASDTPEIRVKKTLLVVGSLMVIAASIIWGLIYLRYDEIDVGLLSISYAGVITLSLLVKFPRRYHQFSFFQLGIGLLMPLAHTILLGGLANSSVVLLWALISPLGALLLYDNRKLAFYWLIAYLSILTVAIFIQPAIAAPNRLPQPLINSFFYMNMIAVSLIAFIVINYFILRKNEALQLLAIEEQKAEDLLLNILPKEIAIILKNEKRTIADQFDGASILFADLVGFTPLSAELAPVEMVKLLNQVFSHFDALVEKYELEKIRTIGDNYMVASGVPRPRPDHAQALACMALDMCSFIEQFPAIHGKRINFRFGINSGPVIGGVIGTKKFVYDLWGDAVNIASRMESQGVPGRIQITPATHQLIQDEFICETRGKIPVKGRGEMETWFLVARKEQAEIELMDKAKIGLISSEIGYHPG